MPRLETTVGEAKQRLAELGAILDEPETWTYDVAAARAEVLSELRARLDRYVWRGDSGLLVRAYRILDEIQAMERPSAEAAT